MRAALTGAALLALVVGHPSLSGVHAAGPDTATIRGEIAIDCAGCGPAKAVFAGTVVAGTGSFAPGAAVRATLAVSPAAGLACPAADSVTGSLMVGGAVVGTVAWTRTGAALSGSLSGGGPVAGTFAFTSPAGTPCGGPATAAVTLTVGDTVDPPVSPGDVAGEAGGVAVGTYEDVRDVRRDGHATVGVLADPVLDEIASTQTLVSWVDGIHIVAQTSFGGPVASYQGVFADPNLWTCTEVMYPGTPTVTCTANPASGIDWECGLMHAQAQSLWEPDFDQPWIHYWGYAAAYVSCDADELVTAQANQWNTPTYAQTPMGPVTTVVCRAQLDANDTSPALPPYHVICVDPPYPGG